MDPPIPVTEKHTQKQTHKPQLYKQILYEMNHNFWDFFKKKEIKKNNKTDIWNGVTVNVLP